VSKEKRTVMASAADRPDVAIPYDYLILATGCAAIATFGHDEFRAVRPRLEDLGRCRRDPQITCLRAFETRRDRGRPDPASRSADVSSLVGAGPSGVEMAGALAVLVRTNPPVGVQAHRSALSARIVLVDMAKPRAGHVLREKALGGSETTAWSAWGSRCGSGAAVERIDDDGVVVGGGAHRQ